MTASGFSTAAIKDKGFINAMQAVAGSKAGFVDLD